MRRLRRYRLLTNAFAPLLAMALAVLVFRWVFPWLFSVLVYVWAAAALLLGLWAVPWFLLSRDFYKGRIKCPACEAPFATQFHLWIPKTCQSCGFDVTSPQSRVAAPKRP